MILGLKFWSRWGPDAKIQNHPLRIRLRAAVFAEYGAKGLTKTRNFRFYFGSIHFEEISQKQIECIFFPSILKGIDI